MNFSNICTILGMFVCRRLLLPHIVLLRQFICNTSGEPFVEWFFFQSQLKSWKIRITDAYSRSKETSKSSASRFCPKGRLPGTLWSQLGRRDSSGNTRFRLYGGKSVFTTNSRWLHRSRIMDCISRICRKWSAEAFKAWYTSSSFTFYSKRKVDWLFQTQSCQI